MSKHQNQHDELDNVNDALSKAEQFIQQYQKPLLIAAAVVIVAISVFFAVRQFYLVPREKAAQIALFQGERYFQTDSFRLALKGNGGDFVGFEAIADEYSMTKTSNLAKAYAGVCYMRLGEYDKAIDFLKDFDANDQLVSPAIIGAIGDCYVEMNKVDDGISYFEKAASRADNNLISPIYLKKAGIAYESLKKYDDAIKAYTKIKDDYAVSSEASDIEKYIERANKLKSAK